MLLHLQQQARAGARQATLALGTIKNAAQPCGLNGAHDRLPLHGKAGDSPLNEALALSSELMLPCLFCFFLDAITLVGKEIDHDTAKGFLAYDQRVIIHQEER